VRRSVPVPAPFSYRSAAPRADAADRHRVVTVATIPPLLFPPRGGLLRLAALAFATALAVLVHTNAAAASLPFYSRLLIAVNMALLPSRSHSSRSRR